MLKTRTQIHTTEFERLEKFTRHYSDLSTLKGIFKEAVSAFDKEFKDLETKRIKQNSSDGGFLPFEREFKLIAWLFINPISHK